MNESIHYKLLDVASNGKNLLKPVITEELGVMMSDHGLTLDEAVIFSFVLKYSLQSSSVELEMFESELIKKGDRNYIKILKDLKNMEKKGVILLNSDGRRRRGRKDSFNPTISIDDSVFSSVVLGEDIYGKTDFSDTYSVLEAMDEIIEKRSDKKISEERFIRDFEVFFDKIDIRLPLKRLAVKYSEIERAMLFRACVTKLKGNGRDDCNNFIAGIYDSLKAVAMVMRKIYQDTMPAFRDKTLQLVESGNFQHNDKPGL